MITDEQTIVSDFDTIVYLFNISYNMIGFFFFIIYTVRVDEIICNQTGTASLSWF